MAAVQALDEVAGAAGDQRPGARRAHPERHRFRGRSPFVVPEDGKNLNRCFPGNPAGTLAERLAHAAFTQLITGPTP